MTHHVSGTMPDERERQRDADRDRDERHSEPAADEIRPGMVVEATEGDLGERDVSRPRVKDVVRDEAGGVREVVVEKGVVFRKTIDVPAERIEAVTPPEDCDDGCGEVVVETREPEVEALTPAGTEALPPLEPGRRETAEDRDGLLDTVEENVPTAEGLRRLEGSNERAGAAGVPLPNDPAKPPEEPNESNEPGEQRASLLRTIGPGFLAGMSGNDSTAVTSYAVNGASVGYGQLWLMLLSTPLYQAVQYACAHIGRITQKGFSAILRDHYGRRVAVPVSILLIIGNLALIAGDLTAIGSGLELITGVRWTWFVVPVAAALWYVTVYQNFGVIKKVFIVMSFAFVSYLVTGFFSGARWGEVLVGTFVPHLSLGFAGISSAVALLGATLSPYSMFWQVQGEKEEQRPGSTRRQLRLATADVASGAIAGNLIAYFIIVCTATTLYTHHQQIQTAADAARALQPLLGPFATYLFAIGLVGAGLVAVPILLASTSYALSDTFGWTASLWRKPWQSEGFYLILTAALVGALVIALLGVNPIRLMFWANILQAALAPVLVALLIAVGRNRRIMREFRLGWLTTACLVAAMVVLLAGTALLVWGLAAGQGR